MVVCAPKWRHPSIFFKPKVRQTVHYLKGIGEVSCIERPLSKGRESNFWNIEIDIPSECISYRRERVYSHEMDDIVIDMLVKVFNGNLEDFRVYEFWQN